MRLTSTVELEYESEEIARKVHASVCVDNEGYVETEVVGRTLRAVAEAGDARSLANTLNDLLACIGIAEETIIGAVEQDGGP